MRTLLLDTRFLATLVLSTVIGASAARADADFVRGDVNQDGAVQLSDAMSIICGLFLGCPSSPCQDAEDVNDSGDVDLSDPIFLLSYLFLDGDIRPPAPFPSCGVDETADGLPCESFATIDCQPGEGEILGPIEGLVSVVGQVIDLRGEPLAGVEVSIGREIEEEPREPIITGAQG